MSQNSRSIEKGKSPKSVGASRTARPMSGKTVGVVLTRFRNKVDAKHMINAWNRIMDTRKGINREEVLVAARFSGSE